MTRASLGTLCACLGMAGLAATSAAAQPAASTDSVEEVVVTAQRRTERALDVPIAVTAASGQQLERAGIVSIEQLSRVAPGIIISRTGAYSQPAIRGISTQNAGAGADNNVAVYVDGVFRPFQRSLLMDLINLNSIEVLKGPQGTLFGRNATGGAILINTLDPTPTPSGKFAVTYGRFNDRSAAGYASVPLNDMIGVSVSAYKRKSDNYIRDISGFDPAPINNGAVTAKLLFRPTDELAVTLGYENRTTSESTGLTYNYINNSIVTQVLSPSSPRSVKRNVTSLNRPNVARDFFKLYSGHLRWEGEWGTLNSWTAWQTDNSKVRFDYDGTPYEFSDQSYRENNDAFTQEINLSSPEGHKLSYVAGLFYMKSNAAYHDYRIRSFSPALGAVATTLVNVNSLETKAIAAYVDATYEVIPSWFLTGGLRYGTEDRDAVFLSGATGALLGQKSGTFKSVTPRAVLRHSMGGDANVYASFSKGYKAGNFNISAPFTEIRPEKLTAYEVGYKALLTNRIRVNASAYYYDYKDLQVTSFIIDAVGRATTQTTNAGTAEVKGAELEIISRITDRFDLRLSGAYNNAKYDKYDRFSPVLLNATTRLNVSACPTAANPTAPCIVDISGQTLIRAPKWTFNANGSYVIPLENGDITLVGNVAYTSSYAPTRPDFALNPANVVNGIVQPSGKGFRFGQAGYTLVNVRATWNYNKNWAFSVYGNNIFDHDYLISHSGNTNGEFLTHGEPRVYGARVEYNF